MDPKMEKMEMEIRNFQISNLEKKKALMELMLKYITLESPSRGSMVL